MNMPAPQVVLSPERESSLVTVGHISYLLHTIVAVTAVLPGTQASILLLLVAFILDLVKKGEAEGSSHESLHTARERSDNRAAVLYVVTIPLWLLFIIPGWIAWALISIWFLYRVVRGWMNLNNRKPMPQ